MKHLIETRLDLPVDEAVPLARHTSLGIGGPARWLARVGSAEELGGVLSLARKRRCPVLVIGGGTNLLVSDEGFDGLVVRLELDELEVHPDRGRVIVGAGVETAALVDRAVQAGLAGLEFAAGLPGTVGGALAGNAGCFGHCLSDRLVSATVVTADGAVLPVDDPAWFEFGYRRSRVQGSRVVIARAELDLAPGDRDALQAETDAKVRIRREKHPLPGAKTAGSYFKNLAPLRDGERRRAAGALLEQVGAKELAVGDAAVFEKHANIVVNRGTAKARDVLELTAEMARRVEERFGEQLTPEVRFVGPRPK